MKERSESQRVGVWKQTGDPLGLNRFGVLKPTQDPTPEPFGFPSLPESLPESLPDRYPTRCSYQRIRAQIS